LTRQFRRVRRGKEGLRSRRGLSKKSTKGKRQIGALNGEGGSGLKRPFRKRGMYRRVCRGLVLGLSSETNSVAVGGDIRQPVEAKKGEKDSCYKESTGCRRGKGLVPPYAPGGALPPVLGRRWGGSLRYQTIGGKET